MKTTTPAPKFRNKNGSLTPYAFACGYIETAPNGFQLFKDGCWHVRRSHAEWESFDGPRGLTEARAHFRKVSKLPVTV